MAPATDNGHLVDVRVGQRIRRRRMERGWTHEELANKLQLGIAELGNYERGSQRVSAATLIEFAKALNVGIGYFFADLSPQHVCRAYNDEQDKESVHEGLELMRAFALIDDAETRRLVVTFVRSLARAGD